jgi:pimeloyl-ACP methyl ester carboxylesterase
MPDMPYEVVHIKSHVDLEGWLMPAEGIAKGTVILFHGYTSCKSMILPRAYPLLRAGYNCLLVDFMGSGGSGGNGTTIGYREAMEVADCYRFIEAKNEQKIYMLGSSMGAVAIMKALNDYKLGPKGVISECPFATMQETVEARFKMLHVPSFPMAGLLVFWGGVENGFWPYGHNPVDYAKNIKCPVLLQYGVHDDRVTRGEIDRIYYNLPGTAQLAIYPKAGHDDYMAKSPEEWTKNVTGFLEAN